MAVGNSLHISIGNRLRQAGNGSRLEKETPEHVKSRIHDNEDMRPRSTLDWLVPQEYEGSSAQLNLQVRVSMNSVVVVRISNVRQCQSILMMSAVSSAP